MLQHSALLSPPCWDGALAEAVREHSCPRVRGVGVMGIAAMEEPARFFLTQETEAGVV